MATSEAMTTVGPQTHIVGDLKGDEDLTVSGRVDGSVSLSRTLTVEPSGIVVAEVTAESAVVGGTVVGNITASDLVHIQSDGRVVGDVSAARVVFADGAAFRGNVDMSGIAEVPTAISAPSPARKPAVIASRSPSTRASKTKAKKIKSRAKKAAASNTTPRPQTIAGKKVRARRR